MSRYKTFDSTGLATAGRLYAGDLNAIQDRYSDQTDLAQAHSVGSLVIGESGLQLVRYGAGEARLSGAFRTDGIIRALGGAYFGAFTTTQRDAISAGFRPFGLVVLNTTNNRLEINLGSDAAPSWSGLSSSITSGTLGTRPGPSATNANSFYFATDDNGGTLYYSTGSAWTKISRGLTEAITAAMIPSGAIDDSKVAAGAAIAQSKLALAIANAQVAAGAGILQSKLATLVITDTEVGVGALSPNRIAGTAVITSDGRLSDARVPVVGSVTDTVVGVGALSPNRISGTALVQADRAAVVVGQSTQQSLPPSTLTTLTWDVERSDASAMHAPGTPTRLVAPTTGVYVVSFLIESNMLGGGNDYVRVDRNGVEIHRFSSGSVGQSLPIVMSANDYIELKLWNSASSTTYATTLNGEAPKFSLYRIA